MAAPAPPESSIIHASCVARDGTGLLIRGPSGSGKSALALQLMALGAGLVADDRVVLTTGPSGLIADAPAAIRGLIEARGLGLLRADPCGPVHVAWLLDLENVETERLPPERETMLLGHPVPLLFRADTLHFPAALYQLLAKGRRGDT